MKKYSEEKIRYTEKFIQKYSEEKELIYSNSSSFMNKHREEAFENFKNLGVPTKKDEAYRYTNLTALYTSDFQSILRNFSQNIDIEEIFKCDIPELDTNLILLVNGWYYSQNGKNLVKLDSGVIYGSVQAASDKYPEIIENHYNKIAENNSDGLVALNTASAQDGVFIFVPKNAVSKKPIQIVNLLTHNQDSIVQHRNIIIAEENSEIEIIVCDHTLSPNRYFTNSVTEIFAKENAKIEYYKIQNEHNGSSQISSTFVNQLRYSNVNSNIISLHGGLIRNNVNVKLEEEACENNTYGLYLTDKMQHVANFTNIEHKSTDSTSVQMFKGVLDDLATGAFNGKIHVHPDAQRTNAFQTNNNILLTKDAKMYTKPQLEIYADDVKCSHGATVGQIDDDALFYCQSRGIAKKDARLLLMYAFSHEIIEKIKVKPLRERIDELIEKRLRGELSRCNNCAMNCE